MALTDSLPTGDAGGLTVVDERLILAGLIAKNSDGTARVGVFPAGSGPIVTGRATMGYDIAPFKSVASRTGNGVELVANDAVTTVATTVAPGANSRIDVIWFRTQFTANTDPGNVPIFGVTQGTAAGVPTKPPIPAGAVELATAQVPSTATTTASVVITQSGPLTAAAGGIVPVRNSADLTAYDAAPGTTARRLDNGILQYRDGTAWVAQPTAPFKTVAGETYVSAAAGVTVTFPAGSFSVPPIIRADPYNASSVLVPLITSRTATSFFLRVYTLGAVATTANVGWTAIQMTPTSAGG